jgi:hypothetical protein
MGITANTNALRQIPTHYGKYQRIMANIDIWNQISTYCDENRRIVANGMFDPE